METAFSISNPMKSPPVIGVHRPDAVIGSDGRLGADAVSWRSSPFIILMEVLERL